MMKKTSDPLCEQLTAAQPHEYGRLWDEARQQGYTYFRNFLEALRDQLKLADEDQLPQTYALLAKAREAFPAPGEISPSWTYIWDEMAHLLDCKKEAMAHIPPADREGEWQIIMDNPYTNESIVCYPGLSFLEAAYLYGYFRPGLKRNEYIRMQKIVSMFEYTGSSR